MKLVLLQVYSLNLLVCYLAASRVFPAIQAAGHLQPFGGRRARDQIDDRLIITKRFAAPIRGDEGEQPVFYLVPLAGAGREVTDGNRKARFIRQLLQLQFPKAQPRAIAASAVCRDKQLPRLRIQRFTFHNSPKGF